VKKNWRNWQAALARAFRKIVLPACRTPQTKGRRAIGKAFIASAMLLLSLGAAQAQTATTTQLISGPNPSAGGEAVLFSATVSPTPAVAPGAPTPTGTVIFFDGGTQIGTGTHQ
jgi:hypothetical protein